jgi:transposase
MQALSGNTSDKTAFNTTVKNHIEQLQAVHSFEVLVADSAFYTKDTLSACGSNTKWVSRVPETLDECKKVISKEYTNWYSFENGYKYVPLKAVYADIEQRYLLVFSPQAYKREMHTFREKFAKESQKESQSLVNLCRQTFGCKPDATTAYNKFKKKCKYINISDLALVEMPVFEGKGRPKKDAKPIKYNYKIEAFSFCEVSSLEARSQTKGRFIIATNEMDTAKLSDLELLTTYKGQSKVEKGFRFLKDPQFMASTMFVKKPERVEALLFIMTLCLTVYAAIEYKIRQKLVEEDQTVPNQLGKQVKNPTTRWIFACFSGIHVLNTPEKVMILNLKPLHSKVIGLLGDTFKKYYLLI